MKKTKISYMLYNKDPSKELVLGSIFLENIDEVLIPINEKNTPFFITMKFSGNECSRWKVNFVLGVKKNQWGIWLSPKEDNNVEYLSDTLLRQRKKSSLQLIRKGTIVIVEYGHIYKVLNFESGLSGSNMYPCSIQKGEIHKRRPAIVVGEDSSGVKVVPITSSPPTGSGVVHSIFELESKSTDNISEFTPGRQSFALCGMVQNISHNRILPPTIRESGSKTFSANYRYPRKLSRNDLIALDNGLLSLIGMPKLKENHINLSNENKEKNKELIESQEKNKTLAENIAMLENKFAILMSLYAGGRPFEDVNTEIDEFMAL